MAENLATASQNDTYTSGNIQDMFITVNRDHIRDQIIHCGETVPQVSVSVDEITDRSDNEQLSLVLGYCDTDGHTQGDFV